MKPPKKPRWDELDAKLAEKTVDITTVSAEQFLEDPEFCDIAITPAQRALARLSEGLPITHLEPHELHYHCGARTLLHARQRPKRVYVRSGRRSGKSLIATMLGLVRPALTLPLRRPPEAGERPERDGLVGVRKGEPVRGLIVAPRLGQAVSTLGILMLVRESPRLGKYVSKIGAESLTIRRDDGQEVTFEVKAAIPRGTNLRGGWFAGCVFDEGAFFGQDDAAVKLDEQIDAIEPAVVRGGQIWVVSSPWDESGRFHLDHTEVFGVPGESVSFHSSSQRMNPQHCDEEDIEAQRLKRPDFVSREFDAVPMVAGGDQFFPEAAIVAACTRDQPMKLEPNDAPHWAGCDLGLRKNSATIAIARASAGRAVLAFYDELVPPRKSAQEAMEDRKRGVAPGLSPRAVFESFATTALSYRCSSIRGDQYHDDEAIEQIGAVKTKRGDSVYYDTFVDNDSSTAEIFTKFRAMMNEGLVELPRDPRLMQQMRDTRTRISSHGKVAITLPRTGAAHGDLLKAVVLAMVQVPLDEEWSDVGAVGSGRRRWGGLGSRRG